MAQWPRTRFVHGLLFSLSAATVVCRPAPSTASPSSNNFSVHRPTCSRNIMYFITAGAEISSRPNANRLLKKNRTHRLLPIAVESGEGYSLYINQSVTGGWADACSDGRSKQGAPSPWTNQTPCDTDVLSAKPMTSRRHRHVTVMIAESIGIIYGAHGIDSDRLHA